MADKKTILMAQFYQQCLEKGYTDMHDATQSLKAKVIASDLNLNYRDIVTFHEKAKVCYDQVQAENAETQRLLAIQQQRDAEIAAQRAVNGELLVTISDSWNKPKSVLRVYIRPDKTLYTTRNNGHKIEGVPAINLHKGGILLTTFHPSQAVYTGATVGGITTGGVHYTKESYSEKVSSTDKGYISAKIGDTDFTIDLIEISDYAREKFRRDPQMRSLGRQILCYNVNFDGSSFMQLAMTKTDYASRMNVMSVAADEHRLPFSRCQQITDLLVRILSAQFPPSDEEVYAKASALAEAGDSATLKRAMELFGHINDFSDAAKRIEQVKEKYEEVLQAEKEQAILAKEAEARKTKKTMAIMIPAAIIIIVASVLISYLVNAHREKTTYAEAVAHMEAGQYQEAIDAFAKIPDYEDSAQLMAEAKLEHAYHQALDAIEQKQYKDAINILKDLSYKDSAELYLDACYQYGVEYLNAENYKAAQQMFESCIDYQFAKDLWKLAEVYKLRDKEKYVDACHQLITLSAEYITENQAFYDELHATCVWDAIEKECITLEYALLMLDSLAEPYKSEAAYTVDIFTKLISFAGKFQQNESQYGPYYLTISFITYNGQVGAVVEYTNYTGTLAIGTAAWNFDVNEDGQMHEYPIKIECPAVNSSRTFIFYIGLETAKVTGIGPYTFFRIE